MCTSMTNNWLEFRFQIMKGQRQNLRIRLYNSLYICGIFQGSFGDKIWYCRYYLLQAHSALVMSTGHSLLLAKHLAIGRGLTPPSPIDIRPMRSLRWPQVRSQFRLLAVIISFSRGALLLHRKELLPLSSLRYLAVRSRSGPLLFVFQQCQGFHTDNTRFCHLFLSIGEWFVIGEYMLRFHY